MNQTHEHIALAIRAEHRQLHRRLHEVELLLTEQVPAVEVARRIVQELATLRGQLAEHFDREETGGFLDEAVSLAPRLSPDVGRLIHDHSALLAELDRTIELARDAVTADEYTALREKACDFFHALRLHEASEDRILQGMFPSELDAGD
jgi:hypothetical protein